MLRSITLLLLAAFLLVLPACSSRPNLRRRSAARPAAEEQRGVRLAAAESAARSAPRLTALKGRGPDFLAFPPRDDRIIARVGDEELYKSQVFDAMMESAPEQVRATIAVLLSNRVLAAECEKHGIRIDEREIDSWFVQHRQAMLQQAVADYGRGTDFRTWVRLRFGQSLTEYERVARNRERARRMLSRLIRFQELREDRVQLRIISTADRQRIEHVRRQAEQGADFATLAQQFSVHPSAEGGGLMPFVWRGSLNPALDRIAFDLPVGVISDVVQTRDQSGRERWQIVKVIRRMKGRDVAWRDVEDEVVAGLKETPLSQDEWYMWQLKLNKLARLKVEPF